MWSRRLNVRRIVTHDFPLKAAAILIAVLFWVANAQNAAPREIVVTFDGRVAVERPEIPSGFVLRGQLGDVGVRLSGPEGVVDHIALADLHATLDISGIDASRPEPSDAKVVVTVSPPLNETVKVVDVTPATVSVRIERITSRTLVVQTRLANEPPKGQQAGQTSVSPKEVRVVGPESAVAQIAAVFATVRFGDLTTDITQSAPAIPVDAAGLPIDGLQVEPGVVVVSVPLLPIATTRTVPVLWTLRGAVASGYWISLISTDPVAVTVSGDQQVLGILERVETAAIDVSGLTGTRSFHAPLLLPDGASLLQQTDATVTVTVVPLAGTRPFLVAVQVLNLASGTVAEIDPNTVTAILSGQAPTLGGLTADQVTATIDAAGRSPGVYQVDVAVRAPNGTTVQSVQPTRVTLTIKTK
jgi:YbbR domain-containing protein